MKFLSINLERKNKLLLYRSEESINNEIKGYELIKKETVNNFIKKNQRYYYLENKFILPIKYRILNKEEIDKCDAKGQEDFWTNFRKEFLGLDEPKSFSDMLGWSGLYSFSRVGFNKEKDQALLYLDNMRWSLSGYGTLVFLVKENDKWIVLWYLSMWIS